MKDKKLVAVWKSSRTVLANEAFLSFLPPGDEDKIAQAYKGVFYSARVVSQDVREQARKVYVDAVTAIGTSVAGSNSESFRSLLVDDHTGGLSLWWFHNVSFRDCESDSAFNQIIQILTVKKVMNEGGYSRLELYGAPAEVAAVLKEMFKLDTFNCLKTRVGIKEYVKACLGRIRYLIVEARKIAAVRGAVSLPQKNVDVAISGFWDWSVRPDPVQETRLTDRYFKRLPEKLVQRGMSVCWFVWLDHEFEGVIGRSNHEVLTPAIGNQSVIFPQFFLSVKDILRCVLNIRPLLVYLKYVASGRLRLALKNDDMNLYHIFHPLLLKGFLDSSIGHHRLVHIAFKRALAQCQPKAMLHFLEFFPHSRAIYAAKYGVKSPVVHYAMQHASYSREKTFVLYDAEKEVGGKPDGYGVPVPDHIFAMGSLGRDIFMESGIKPEFVSLTGSARYDHIIKSNRFQKKAKESQDLVILLACSLNIEPELEMLEAVTSAVRTIPNVSLRLRSHPFARLEKRSEFAVFRDMIEVSDVSLDEDMVLANLVIFTCTTVAEEALLHGIPVWQWRSCAYNASVLRDIQGVPFFCSVSALRDAITSFVESANNVVVSNVLVDNVVEKCFYKADGNAGERIADVVYKYLCKERLL